MVVSGGILRYGMSNEANTMDGQVYSGAAADMISPGDPISRIRWITN